MIVGQAEHWYEPVPLATEEYAEHAVHVWEVDVTDRTEDEYQPSAQGVHFPPETTVPLGQYEHWFGEDGRMPVTL
jgi:hypothetical protein